MKFLLLTMMFGFGVAFAAPEEASSLKSSIIQNHPLREEMSPLSPKKNAQAKKATKNAPNSCIYEDFYWGFRQQSKIPAAEA